MLNFIKKHKIILILLIFTLFLLINTKVNATDDVETMKTSVFRAFAHQLFPDDTGGIGASASYTANLSQDKTLSLYFIYNNPEKFCYDVIIITTGNTSIKTGTNGFLSNNTQHTFYQNKSGSDWRTNVRCSHVVVDYSYNLISKETITTGVGAGVKTYNVNELFGLNNITYNNLLAVSPNYKSTFLKIFPDFKETVPVIENEVVPFHLEYNEDTQSYFVYTDYMNYENFKSNFAYFNIDGFQTSFYFDTYENYGWKLMDFESSSYGNEDGTNDWRYYQEIFEYGEYYFCLWNYDTEIYNIYCIEIVADSSTISRFNKDYTDSSDIFIEIEKNTYEYKDYLSNNNQNFYITYVDNVAVVYSNYFKEDDSYYYDCLFSKDYINYNNDIITEYYDGANINYSKYYRFCKEINENGTYYFRLRKIDKTTGNIISSNIYTINVDGIIVNNVGENDTVEFYKNTNTMAYFRNTLGIIFFPIDMMFDFFERLEDIQYQEPIIEVPDIKEPFTRTSFY